MYYKATVYDPKENKIGEIDDVILDKSGKVAALVVGVGPVVAYGVAFAFMAAGAILIFLVPKPSQKTVSEDKSWAYIVAGFGFIKNVEDGDVLEKHKRWMNK